MANAALNCATTHRATAAQSHLTSRTPWAKLPQHLEFARERSATISL
jgi:hypothetical protein